MGFKTLMPSVHKENGYRSCVSDIRFLLPLFGLYVPIQVCIDFCQIATLVNTSWCATTSRRQKQHAVTYRYALLARLYASLGLMLRTEQVVDGLHGVEGLDGHFYKHRVPVAHGAIPQTGQLKSLQLAAVLAL